MVLGTWMSAGPFGQPPAQALTVVLRALRTRLLALSEGGCRAGLDQPARCLDALHHYLAEELTPVLLAIDVRIRPALRGYGAQDRAAAADKAALLRLGEQVALLRAQRPMTGSSHDTGAAVAAVTDRLIGLANSYLAREERVLPALLRRLPPAEAARILGAAGRTARAAAAAPRRDLLPAGL